VTPKIVYRASLNFCWPIQWLGFHREYLQEGEMEIIAALLREVEAKSMIEFGCRDGRTACVLLRNVSSLESYVGVDVPFEYQPELEHQQREMVREPGHLAMSDPRFQLVIRERGSLDLGPGSFEQAFDACFIDGDHSARVVEHDSHLARALVRPGGVIIWHDYHQSDHVNVRPVIDKLCDKGWPINHVQGTWLAFCRT
jgi:predicted O-methyltransferase YrrM